MTYTKATRVRVVCPDSQSVAYSPRSGATDTFYYWDENVQDFVQFVAEGTEGTEAGGDGGGGDAMDVPEEHAEAVEGWNPSFVDYWEDEN